jgi:hypothetical protein
MRVDKYGGRTRLQTKKEGVDHGNKIRGNEKGKVGHG